MNQSISRRRLVATSLAVPAAGLILPGLTTAQQATPVAIDATPAAETSGGWPFYGHDLTGAKATSGGVSSANIAELGAAWEVQVGGAVSSTPVIADGVAYCGSYDGNLYAIDLFSGEVLWTYASGSEVIEPNLQVPLGITGSAAVANGVIYVGDSAATVHAIDAATGQAIWTVKVEDAANGSVWSSPVVLGDVIYLGVASIAKEEGFRGSVIALNAADGSTVWQTYMVPEGADGAGVFAVPAIDEARGALYVGTQNAYSPNPAPYGDPISVVALDLATGELKWAFNAPEDGPTAPVDDVGFSASPNLFSVEINGETRDLVGNGQKSGEYWALDRDTGEVVWQALVSPPGFLGGMEGTSATANGVIAVPATDWPEVDGPAKGMVTALDAATGEELWSAEQTAPAASPAAISDDVVFHAGFDGILHAYALASGEELWSFDMGASVSGGIAVSDGVVVLGAATPQFAPFILPGSSIRGFAIGASAAPATPEAVASPVA